MNIEQFQSELKKLQININEDQLKKFEQYYQALIEWNKKMNLTAITEKNEVYLKHFYDSLTIVKKFPFSLAEPLKICDVGAGAGFPSIPLKIAYPDLQITIVDSLKKRITFLEHLAEVLELKNVSFYHDRAETFGRNKEHRAQYDIVTARAVARISVLSEFCLPLVKKGGYFIALKGSGGREELEEGKRAVTILGGKVREILSFQLPIENSDRTIIHIQKVKNTPKKYPRKPGVPSKNPL